MLRSIPITDAPGALVAVAAHGDHGWYLIALDPILDDLDRTNFPDADAAKRAVRLALQRQRPETSWPMPPRPPAVEHAR